MEPPNYKTVVTVTQSTPESDRCRKREGSLKFKSMRPRSRTGSGGILRVDITKPNVTSSELGQDPPSPQPSVDRLSVTFAAEERSICSSDTSVKLNVYVPGTPPISCMEKVRFPTITDGEDSEEDYSASVTAIMQRRASTRKSRRKHRRTSSPFSHDQESLQVRRRSSCITTSSGDTAISIEESLPQEVTQEQIFENIRLHKEVLSSVKMQPWIMKRKLKLVQQAKSYIKRHQGALQERLAQSRSTRDILARWNIYLVQKLQHVRRELANLSNLLIPWESRIKEIESHFGSVVASYFTFLRWLFWVNLIISIVLVAFVAIPELLTADLKSAGERKVILPEEKRRSTNLFTLWDFEGILKYSPLFYGYYTNRDGTEKGYRLPFAYFMTGLGVYVYSFVATLRKMAENSRMSKLSEKDDECIFSWKLFTGWDYMIGNSETAQNRIASIILGFKEALLEEAEKKREVRNWKIIASRIMVNLLVLSLLVVSAYAVIEVVQRSTDQEALAKSFWRRNETTIVMSLITFLFPMFFEILGFFEHYHPRKQLRLQLARIMVLNILNLYSLIFSLFDKIKDMTKELQQMKNETIYFDTIELTTDATTPYSVENQTCYEVLIDCSQVNAFSSASLILTNISLAFLLTHLNQTQKIPDIFKFTNYNISKFTEHNVDLSILSNINFTKLPEKDAYKRYNSDVEYLNEDSNYYEDEDYFNFDYNTLPNINEDSLKNIETTTKFESLNDTTDYYDEEDYFNFDYSTLDYSDQKPSSSEDNSKNIDSTTEFEDLNDTVYYENNEEYFNFDYSSLENPNNKTKNVTENISKKDNPITDYEYPNETSEYYEDNDEYFNFDYSSLEKPETETTTFNIAENISNIELQESFDYISNFSNNSSIEDLILQTVISTLLNNSSTENNSETITIIWNTEELLSTVSSVLNLSITINDSVEFSTEISETNITDIITNFFENITTETTPFCKISKCDPFREIKNTALQKITTNPPSYDYDLRKKLRKLCWETLFGQELVKLTVMDLFFTIFSILAVDFIRAMFVRIMNSCWCWDLEKKFPQYGDFKIAENILHLVNNQGMVWMGMFFSPGIPIINLVKLAIMMYLRSWAVLTCNVPHEVVFRASRSNNFYLALLLTMLFLCVLPVGFAIVWIEPSWHCGPFSNYSRIYYIFTKSLKNALPKALRPFLDYIASPFIVIPLLVLLILIIYYMISLTNALREANNDLKLQLRRERTEERRKMFQIVDRRRRNGSGDSGDMENTPFGKWKKLLPMLPNSKSFDADTSKENENDDKNVDNTNKDFLVKFIKKAMKKPPTVSSPAADDATDTEQHESLPDDINIKADKDKRVLHNFRKILHAKKQQRDIEATQKPEQLHSTKSSSNDSKTKIKKSDKISEKYRSTSHSSSSKDFRQDSLSSNWSDNIPVIKISGTGSSECILEHQNECSPSSSPRKPPKIIHQDHVEDIICETQKAEPQCAISSSSETLVTVKVEELDAEKQKEAFLSSKNKPERIKSKSKDVSSFETDQSIDLQKTSNSDSTQTKSESSSDYKE